MTPKISIIIPVYNVEKYLRQCLDSAMNQTLQEIEIICMDDGSTDTSGAILEEYAARDSRFIVLHQENAGLSVARNKGLEIARGEYIAFLDSDDWYDLTLCEKAYRKARERQAEMTLFFFHCVNAPEKYEPLFYKIRCKNETEEYRKLKLVSRTFTVVWNILFRREFIKENQLRFLERHLFEDTYFSLKAAILANEIAILKEKLYFYRYGSGLSTSPAQTGNWLKKFNMLDKMIPDLLSIARTSKSEYFIYATLYNAYRDIYRRFNGEMQKKCEEEIRRRLTPDDWQKIHSYNPQLRTSVRKFIYQIYGKKWSYLWVKLRIFYSCLFSKKNFIPR